MKVVLKKDVKELGKSGSVVNVAEGYARNFLFPRKLAVIADTGAMNTIEQKKKVLEIKGEHILADAKAIAEKLNNLKIVIKAKVGTGSKLYGSVTTQDIADALLREHSISLDKRKLHINEPIKSLGSFEVPVKLHHEVTATIHVEVVGQSE